MSKVKLTLPGLEIPVTGKQVTFSAPCDCSSVECLQINGVDYCVVDALGRQVTGTTGGGVWATGAKVSVILDCEEKKAYLQNGNPTLSTIGAGMVNPNLLHNWYFANPVNQRNGYIIPPGTQMYYDTAFTQPFGNPLAGYEPISFSTAGYIGFYVGDTPAYTQPTNKVRGYVGGVYTIDRWGHNGGTVQIGGGLSWQQAYVLYQPFEYSLNDGNRRTFSYLDSTGNLASGELTTEYSLIGEVMVCHANTNNLYLLSTRSDLKIAAVKLELGSTQTLAHQDASGNWALNEIPDYSEELLKCCMSKADSGDLYAGNKKTPAAINAVSKSGDIMTNALAFSNPANNFLSRVYNDEEGAALETVDVNNGVWQPATTRRIQIMSKAVEGDVKKALRFGDWTTGQWYNILHTGNMESLGCGKIATGSYVGTGCCGPDYANVLTFSFKPALVVVVGWDTVKSFGGSITLVQGASVCGDTGAGQLDSCKVTWDGNSVSWYYGSTNYDEDDSFGYPWRQYNASNTTYHWFAIG